MLSSWAWAGSTTLTTYYPPPKAAYNKVNLATNYAIPVNNSSMGSYCTSSNVGATYCVCAGLSNGANCANCPTTPTYYVCTGAGFSTAATGVVHGDANGNLHEVMSGQDIIYPQECYNNFCSYTIAYGQTCAGMLVGSSCHASGYDTNYGTPTKGKCLNSSFYEIPVNQTNAYYDLFQTSPTNCVVSVICCTSGTYNAAGALDPNGNPPDETTTTFTSTTT